MDTIFLRIAELFLLVTLCHLTRMYIYGTVKGRRTNRCLETFIIFKQHRHNGLHVRRSYSGKIIGKYSALCHDPTRVCLLVEFSESDRLHDTGFWGYSFEGKLMFSSEFYGCTCSSCVLRCRFGRELVSWEFHWNFPLTIRSNSKVTPNFHP